MAKSKYKALVIVESPAKARKIGEYLGRDYKVMASMGHIRDLPSSASEIPAAVKKEPWARLAINVDNNFEPLYVVPTEKKKLIKELAGYLAESEELILATDEDREGESIGWHLFEVLKPKVPTRRMVFSEITRDAIQEAIQHTRQLDMKLVEAQETRRVLDRLFGYTLSPLLWKKVAPKLSAGRVQSVAVRMLVIRELERARFHRATYWDLKAALQSPGGPAFEAQLATVGGQRVASGKDFDENTGQLKAGARVTLLDEPQAVALRQRVEAAVWAVSGVETRAEKRSPSPPFTTSTLQQEANRKLGLGARQTMQVAQRLYEDGYITYMRTDSVNLSGEAIGAARRGITDRYGEEYLSPGPRNYTTKSKGAQEAHEAIRPAGKAMKTGEELGLEGAERRLYDLIWKRTIATQMAEARLTFQTATITAADAEFKATGRHVDFPGFFRAYVEGVDDPEAALDDQESALPPLRAADLLTLQQVESLSHETKPPARFTEATLVGRLEAEGIGRPSTYASIIGTIQDRGYSVKQGNQLVPTFTGMAVTRLLENHFGRLVDYQFTARMEQALDEVASGDAEGRPYLEQFYRGDDGIEHQVKVRDAEIDPRVACTVKLDGVLSDIRVGQYGPFLEIEENGEKVRASLPADIAPADVTDALASQLIEQKKQGPQALGLDPQSGLPVFAKIGPFGPYLQLGEVTEDNPKPKRTSVPKGTTLESVTFDQALSYLALPRRLGEHPETGKVVNAGIGRFGPYVVHDGVYKSLTRDHDVLAIGLTEAVELLKTARQKAVATPLRELGAHPEDGEIIGVFEGRYGPYVRHKKVFASLPKDRAVDSVTLAEALEWIAAKAPSRGAKKAAGKKKAAAKKSKAATGDEAPVKKKAATKKKAAAKKKAATKKRAAKAVE